MQFPRFLQSESSLQPVDVDEVVVGFVVAVDAVVVGLVVAVAVVGTIVGEVIGAVVSIKTSQFFPV